MINRHNARSLIGTCFIALASISTAQVNAPGRFQAGIAASLGLHATHFEYSYSVFGLNVGDSHDDGAATVSYPLDLQVGITNRFSLGLCLEPGQYIDSAGTHPNNFFIAGITPRFYLVNKDHFAWLLNADLGFSALRIGDVRSGSKVYDDSYVGGHFRLGTQVQVYFGNTFGINFGMKLAAHSMKWRDRAPEDPGLANLNYAAKLSTSGVQFQLGLQVKL